MTCPKCRGEEVLQEPEEGGMPYYECKECGNKEGADIRAERQGENEARMKRMKERERRAEHW